MNTQTKRRVKRGDKAAFDALLQQFGEEVLEPELAEGMSSGPLGPMIHHALMIEPFFMPELSKAVNARFRAKRERLKRAEEERDWEQAIFLHEKPYRFDALSRYWDRLRIGERASLFIERWTESENLWQTRPVWEGMIEEIPTPAFHKAMRIEDREALEAFEFPLTVYRGADVQGAYGLSYTRNRAKAEWFAQRWSREGELFTLTLDDPDDILFYHDGRQEQEVVVYPEAL